MSERTIRRSHERRIAAESRRRVLTIRRSALAAGASAGAFALAPAAAQAADYEVTTLGDGPVAACTGTSCFNLRDAIAAANATGGVDDTIHFQAALTGTIPLAAAQGELLSNDANALTINAQGITVNADRAPSGFDAGDSRVLHAQGSGQLTVTGMTMTGGYTTAPAGGGAVFLDSGSRVALDHVQITNSYAKPSGPPFNGGGAIGATGSSSHLSVSNSQITGNKSSTVGGAINASDVSVDDSTISTNTAAQRGGAIEVRQKYSVNVSGSTISGNTANFGGGISGDLSDDKYTSLKVSDSTIAGNTGTQRGGGIYFTEMDNGSRATITHSTVSGNHSPVAGKGGGIYFGDTVKGTFQLVDSTISGNDAYIGAGVGVQSAGQNEQIGPEGSIEFNNSTIAGNTAVQTGGGIYLGDYTSNAAQVSGTPELTSTIVADNTASGGPQDLDRVNTSTAGGFDSAFALVEVPGDGNVITTGPNIIGADPQLGGLTNNGGPTLTQLPSGSSPVIDKGWAPIKLTTDQRNQPRTIDLADPNAPRGDGTDIGAVERSTSSFQPAATPGGSNPASSGRKCKKKAKSATANSAKKKKKKKCKKKKHKKK